MNMGGHPPLDNQEDHRPPKKRTISNQEYGPSISCACESFCKCSFTYARTKVFEITFVKVFSLNFPEVFHLVRPCKFLLLGWYQLHQDYTE